MWKAIIKGVSDCDNSQKKPALYSYNSGRVWRFGENQIRISSTRLRIGETWKIPIQFAHEPLRPQDSLCSLQLSTNSTFSAAELPTLNRGFSSCSRPHAIQGLAAPSVPEGYPQLPFLTLPNQAEPRLPTPLDTAAPQLPRLLPRSAPPSCPAAGADVEPQKQRRRWLARRPH